MRNLGDGKVETVGIGQLVGDMYQTNYMILYVRLVYFKHG
jgi:hypothetical protein